MFTIWYASIHLEEHIHTVKGINQKKSTKAKAKSELNTKEAKLYKIIDKK